MTTAAGTKWQYEVISDPDEWSTLWLTVPTEAEAKHIAEGRDHSRFNLSPGNATGEYRVVVRHADGTGYTQQWTTNPTYPTPSYDSEDPTPVQAFLKRSEEYPKPGTRGFIENGAWLKEFLTGISNNISVGVFDISHQHDGETTRVQINFGLTLSRSEVGMPIPTQLADKVVR